MDSDRTKNFEIVVNGKRIGAVDRWNHVSLTIGSRWDKGSDGEKFEVLAAIRRTYNPEDRADIHGNEGQTPAQVGRCEGFKELSYQRVAEPAAPVIIVPPLMRYLRLVPDSQTRNTHLPAGQAVG